MGRRLRALNVSCADIARIYYLHNSLKQEVAHRSAKHLPRQKGRYDKTRYCQKNNTEAVESDEPTRAVTRTFCIFTLEEESRANEIFTYTIAGLTLGVIRVEMTETVRKKCGSPMLVIARPRSWKFIYMFINGNALSWFY